jgi:membrane protein insertase Oxa1/YidC/SpoIIIJ
VLNALVAVYATVAQESSGLTFALVGLLSAAIFMPTAIRNYFDQEQTKSLQDKINTIKAENPDPEKQQQLILKLLKSKDVHFQSESIYLFGQAVILAILYPVVLSHWSKLEPGLLYPFTPQPQNFSADFLGTPLNYSNATISLLPAILLFFELRVAYKEQQFLTSFIDRWYPIILPLFTYFLIFWLPSALSLVLAASLALSLYLKSLLQYFTHMRRSRRLKTA